METKIGRLSQTSLIVGIILILIIVVGAIFFVRASGEKSFFKSAFENKETELAQKEQDLLSCKASLNEIEQAYALSEENGSELLKQLMEERDRNDDFEDQLDDITGTVGKLDKLSKIDPQLLQKYSQIYFLNEHYAPSKFEEIEQRYVVSPDEKEYAHYKIEPFLDDLLDDAKRDRMDLLVLSAFRSYDEQKQLKGSYTVTYGSGANAFSADQGYSEHQLGTTVDFTNSIIGASLTGFETTEEYQWLLKNAHKYGFVLSYPEENGYYIFEPWHWRFVGEDLADDLNDDKQNFYDLEQREIDEYLISLFD
jgi:D-alanyl-D-alanine carboxypeptidase